MASLYLSQYALVVANRTRSIPPKEIARTGQLRPKLTDMLRLVHVKVMEPSKCTFCA
ncbi:MAG: hypothetical protein ACI8P0_005842 [Planctomycetaceae bacterium]|jgi:hypothetical protein